MPRRKLNYKEGDWFVVPLPGGGYALGLAARVDGSGGLLGFFFGPRSQSIPPLSAAEGKQPGDAVMVKMLGDLGLLEGSWVVLGRLPGWLREEWPIPVFGRRDLHKRARGVRVHYTEGNLRTLREEPASAEEIAGLPADGQAGSGWVEQRLAMLLPGDASFQRIPFVENTARVRDLYDGGGHQMDEKRFWQLIESAKRQAAGDVDDQVELLVERLSKLPKREIISFDQILRQLMARSYDSRLWAACYIINGGCSDDGFDYFRGWLVAQGETAFTNAVNDPESLVDVAHRRDVECEDMLYAAQTAYEAKTGKAMPFHDRPALELKGEKWQEEQLREMFPRLWAAFA